MSKLAPGEEVQESYAVTFERLDGQKWEEWSRRAKAWLTATGLWACTQAPLVPAAAGAAAPAIVAAAAELRKDQRAMGLLVLSIDTSQLPHVEGLENAQVIWQALEWVHHRTTVEAKIHVTRSLFELKPRPGDSICRRITKMLAVFNKLHQLNVVFPEELKV